MLWLVWIVLLVMCFCCGSSCVCCVLVGVIMLVSSVVVSSEGIVWFIGERVVIRVFLVCWVVVVDGVWLEKVFIEFEV